MSKIHEKTKHTCLICDEKLTETCTLLHKTRRQTHCLCTDCSIGYLKPILVVITSNLRKNIRNNQEFLECPGSYHGSLKNRCKHKFSVTNITLPVHLDSLSTDLFRITYVLRNPTAFICPNNNCLAVVDVDTGYNNQKLVCRECKNDWCKNCLVTPYHDEKSCLQHEIEDKKSENAQYINELQKTNVLRFCPQCKAPIIRRDGCHKMVCEICHCKWCWLCEAKDIDYSHFNPASNSSCANRLWK